jgi:hypothetical protein
MRLANATICHTTVDAVFLLPHCSSFYIRMKTRRRKKRRKEGRKKENGGIQTNKFLHMFERKQKAHSHRSSRIHPDILQQHLTSVAIAAVPLEN